MKCCNTNRHCEKGMPCPTFVSQLKTANGGQKVDTTADNQDADEPLDTIEKIIVGAVLVCTGGFWVLTIIQASRWLHS